MAKSIYDLLTTSRPLCRDAYCAGEFDWAEALYIEASILGRFRFGSEYGDCPARTGSPFVLQSVPKGGEVAAAVPKAPDRIVFNETTARRAAAPYLLRRICQYYGRPLHQTIVLKARDAHLAGATVLRGPMGFGHSNRIYTTKILRLAEDLPIVVEIVDTEDKDQGVPADAR